MVVIDAVPHPQAILVGFEEGDPDTAAISDMVATTLLLPNGVMGRRRALDWDLWIQRGGDISYEIPRHLHVLAFAANGPGVVEETSGGGASVRYGAGNPSPTMRVNPDLDDDVARLVRHELVPWLQDQEVRPVLVRSGFNSSGTPVRSAGFTCIPFVFDADDHVIAGAFKRSSDHDNPSWVWVLPHMPARPEIWLAAALRRWHELTPHRVPGGTPWTARGRWMTPAEVQAERNLRNLEERSSRWQRLYATRRETLEAESHRAHVAAANGRRRLLTEQGVELEAEVADALALLGYAVTEEDTQREAEGRGKAHDLNVIDPDVKDRRIIAEVKGYAKGARGALAQGQQHILRYSIDNGGLIPDACWLIVNHFREIDPDERPRLLEGADGDIALFAQNGGLVVDTRELFTLVRAVEAGELDPEAARTQLREASSRFVAALGGNT